jgi:hypothetical protein
MRRPTRPGKAARKRSPNPARNAQKPGNWRSHEEQKIVPEGLPVDAREKGWRFKGYDDFVVQELTIEAHTIRYRLETWIGPDGQTLKGRVADLGAGP